MLFHPRYIIRKDKEASVRELLLHEISGALVVFSRAHATQILKELREEVIPTAHMERDAHALLHFLRELARCIGQQLSVKGEGFTDFVPEILKISLTLIKPFIIDERPEVRFSISLETSLLVTFEDGFEKYKLHHFFHPLRNAKLRLGKRKNAVHLITMMGMIVLHIGEVDACMGEVAAHAQVERVDKHLITETASHFDETHRQCSSERSRI